MEAIHLASDTLPDLLSRAVERDPNRTCLTCGDDSVAFGDLESRAVATARAMRHEGLERGARVAVISRDCIACHEVFWACTLAQTVLVGINWRLKPAEMVAILQHCNAQLLIIEAALLPAFEDLRSTCPSLRRVVVLGGADSLSHTEYAMWRDSAPATQALGEPSRTDVVVQLYTSGTTGPAKGVELAHTTFVDLLQGMRALGDEWMGLNQHDRLLHALPFFHIGGLWWVVQGTLAGAAGALMPSFDAAHAVEILTEQRITKAALVPAMIQLVLAQPGCRPGRFALEALLYGASPIPNRLLQQAMSVFGCDFYQIYGMTETGNMAVCLRPSDHSAHGGAYLESAGRALPGVQLKVVSTSGESLPAGEVGEICIKSPSRMVGYFNNPVATSKIMQDGWIYTGDVGCIDADGYVFIKDRLKDMIIYAGEKVFPAEVEAVLQSHPGVKEAAVVGRQHPIWGEIVVAFVVADGSKPKKRGLLDYLTDRLADFKLPRVIEFIPELPRNASGKVLKRELV